MFPLSSAKPIIPLRLKALAGYPADPLENPPEYNFAGLFVFPENCRN